MTPHATYRKSHRLHQHDHSGWTAGFTFPSSNHFIARTIAHGSSATPSVTTAAPIARKPASGNTRRAIATPQNHATATTSGTTGSANRSHSQNSRLTRRIIEGLWVTD